MAIESRVVFVSKPRQSKEDTMAARKTVSVEFVKERTNTFLATSEDSMAEMRKGMSALLESVLFETNTYKGFRYLSTETNDDGTLRDDFDDTRRYYY